MVGDVALVFAEQSLDGFERCVGLGIVNLGNTESHDSGNRHQAPRPRWKCNGKAVADAHVELVSKSAAEHDAIVGCQHGAERSRSDFARERKEFVLLDQVHANQGARYFGCALCVVDLRSNSWGNAQNFLVVAA